MPPTRAALRVESSCRTCALAAAPLLRSPQSAPAGCRIPCRMRPGPPQYLARRAPRAGEVPDLRADIWRTLRFSSDMISRSPAWRLASFSTTADMSPSSCTPFTSIRAPLDWNVQSCLIAPRPRFILPVALRSCPAPERPLPPARRCDVGPVAISTSGMPCRSSCRLCRRRPRRPSLRHPLKAERLDDIRHRHPLSTLVGDLRRPLDPVVFEPSMTSLRMTCTCRQGHVGHGGPVSATFKASAFIPCGGSSSSSTRQTVSRYPWYVKERS
jgi:hypothetical protein